MTLDRLRIWAKNHRWAIAFALVIFAGYTLGKDRALHDNAVADRMATSPLAER